MESQVLRLRKVSGHDCDNHRIGIGIVQGNSTVTFNGLWQRPQVGDTVSWSRPTGATTGPVIVTTSGSPGRARCSGADSTSILNISPNAGRLELNDDCGDRIPIESGTSTIQFNGLQQRQRHGVIARSASPYRPRHERQCCRVDSGVSSNGVSIPWDRQA